MSRNIKMVGLDLDGTLLTTGKELTEYTKEVLRKAMEQGVEVLVSTGRPFSAVPEVLRTFPGMRYAVTANGARILDTEKNQVLYENLLSMKTAEKVLDILMDYDTIHEIFIEGVGYTNAEILKKADKYCDNPSMAKYLQMTRVPVENVKEKLLSVNRPVDKLQGVFRSMEERAEAGKRLEAIEGIVVTGAFRNNLEINRVGTNKGSGLLKLGELLGIEREEIMACGDGMNDFEMLKAVGFAVAMENGHHKIKEIADYVTGTNDEDGVAKAIERFVLK